MTKFRVRVWCEACLGDPEGCFGGAGELMKTYFDTREEAEAAARAYCGSLPYGYRVEAASEQTIDAVPIFADVHIGLPIQ